MNRSNFLVSVTAVFLLTLRGLEAQAPAPANSETGKPVFEEWEVIVMGGKTCGFGSTITTETDSPDGPRYHTVHQEEYVAKRLSSSLKIIDTSKITEDAEGGVLSFSQINQYGGGSEIESDGVREGDEFVVSSRGQKQRYKVPRLGALGPEAVRRMANAVPLQPGRTYSFNTFSSDYPQLTVVESGKIVDHETRDIRGTQRSVWKITSESTLAPGMTATTWVDDKKNDVETLVSIPGIGDLHEYVTNRAECMKQPEGFDIFSTSLIRPQRAIPSPGEQASAVYRLLTVDLSKKLVLWDQGEQHVLSSEPGSCEIEVTVPHFTPADATWQLPHADTPELHDYLKTTAYLEVDSPEIQALAKQAVGDEKNSVIAARRIERFVRNYITKKDLNIGFASAEETAKSREGDCTEHAVLCAALGRAVGLPTRCVFGLGYVPPGANEPTVANTVDKDTGIFAFHMWAEAWIGPDEWVPMDAALDGFDIGHIAITKTALDEMNPLVDLNTSLWQLMDNLKIEIVKTTPKIGATPSAAQTSSEHPSTPTKPPEHNTLPPGVD